MLLSLHVKNFAIIDDVYVDFGPGMNILSGETGAGKSILLGSVSAALGGRVNREMLGRKADYALAELQLYIRDPRQLSDPDKQLALRLRQLALELSSKESFLSEIIGYIRLSYYYNAGLAAAILGDLVDADRFFGYIASSPCGFPICDRARTFLIDRDISALMKTIP